LITMAAFSLTLCALSPHKLRGTNRRIFPVFARLHN
jgi:hypothetical protein